MKRKNMIFTAVLLILIMAVSVGLVFDARSRASGADCGADS